MEREREGGREGGGEREINPLHSTSCNTALAIPGNVAEGAELMHERVHTLRLSELPSTGAILTHIGLLHLHTKTKPLEITSQR